MENLLTALKMVIKSEPDIGIELEKTIGEDWEKTLDEEIENFGESVLEVKGKGRELNKKE